MLSKLNWPLVAVFFIVAASVTTLAVFKVIPPNLVVAIATGFVGWLAPSPILGSPATPAAAAPPLVPPLPLLFVLALLVVVASSCAAGAANAAYDRDLAACELSPTCETWVACRKTAATKNGRTFEAHCNAAGTPVDGGAE